MQALMFARVTGIVTLLSTALHAQPCGRPDLLDTMPRDGAIGVPTNASLMARYALTAEYLNEEITLEQIGEPPAAVDATFDRVEGMLRVEPPEMLPRTRYEIIWPALRGLGTASLGNGASIEFETGDSADVAAPVFGGLTGISWHVERERDECTDTLEERFVFEMTVADASDDGGRESLTLIVFQTKGPGIEASAPKQVSVSGIPESGKSVKTARRVDDAVGDVCFAAIARDLTGRISSGGDRETCVHTAKPPFFYGCQVSGLAVRFPTASWSSLLFGMVTIAWRRRRRS